MMEGGVLYRRWRTVAAILLLCSLALGLTLFSWRGLTKVLGVGKGSDLKQNVVFNEKELESESVLSFVAGTEMVTNDASLQAETKEVAEPDMVEAAWSSSNSSLYCGRNKMKLKVMGPGAVELQLDIGKMEFFPVSQVPDACGIWVKQNAFGLVLLVPYDSCAVAKKNGMYVLKMRWRESVVNVTCSVWPELEVNSTDLVTPQDPFPHKSLSVDRMKRHLRWPPMYVPCRQHRRFPPCLYPTPPPTTTTTTPTTTVAPTHMPHANPLFWKKLFELYPLYSNYFHGQTNPQQHYYHGYKYPRWQMNLQKPQFNHPYHHFLAGYLTPTTRPTTTKATTSSGNCPHSRSCYPLDRWPFAPRGTFVDRDIPDNQQNPLPQSRSGYTGQLNPDSFWESFPLLYHSVSQDEPHADWEDVTPK